MRKLRRFTAAGLISFSLSSTAGAIVLGTSAAPAGADGVCGPTATESGVYGGYMACVQNKTGKVFFVEL